MFTQLTELWLRVSGELFTPMQEDQRSRQGNVLQQLLLMQNNHHPQGSQPAKTVFQLQLSVYGIS